MPDHPVLSLCNLTLGYDRHPAVHHLDAGIGRGHFTALTGPNGAGKSTLLRGIAGMHTPLQGHIRLRAGQVAWLPQRPGLDLDFPLSVADLVAMGCWSRIGAFGALTATHRRRLDEALAAVGLTGFGKRAVGSLSGGQLQRALFARLMLQDADLLLLDEPFSAVDAKTARDLVGVMETWRREGRTVIAALHDLDMIRNHFPRTMLLARTLVAHGATADVLTAANLQAARRMCEAFTVDAAVCPRHAA